MSQSDKIMNFRVRLFWDLFDSYFFKTKRLSIKSPIALVVNCVRIDVQIKWFWFRDPITPFPAIQ